MITRVFIVFLTARLIWLAVLISINMTAIALNVGENLSVKQMVDQTRAMSLRGERFQAQNQLVLALNNSKISMRERTIVKVALNELSRQFFSDKALAIFELGESNLYAKRNREALERYREAQDLEPENTSIFSARVRALLAQGDCAEAEKLAAQSIALQPYDELVKLIQLRSHICTGQSTLFQKRWDSELSDLEKIMDKLSRGSEFLPRTTDQSFRLNPYVRYLWNIQTFPNHVTICFFKQQILRRRGREGKNM
ncbi:MAG: tetratricopeptide repeat protein [Bdellovibrionales bacterium]|nr:tetratricopeptide repeat protein [Bdellovibrionales bacterium]